ncbi:MAG TPA: SPOR domain-containing protein [Paracoccaceae bacterium]|nr:SPOR domain-containing protein [Paracoccaceae bacterium]
MSELTGDPYAYGVSAARPRRGPLATAAGAAVALALLAGLAGWANGLMTRDPGEIPFLRAEDGPMKIAPEDPGGLELEDADRAVTRMMRRGEADAPALAPPAEAPAAEDLPLPRLADEAAAGPPEAEVAPAPREVEPESGAETSPIDAAVAEALRAAEADAPTVAGTAQAPAATPLAPKRPAAEPAAPRTETAAAAPPIALGAGDVAVQLGAFNTEAIAEAQWRRHLDRNEDLLGRLAHAVTTVRSGGRTLWRLRAGPMPSIARAQELCAALEARGDACIVARIR